MKAESDDNSRTGADASRALSSAALKQTANWPLKRPLNDALPEAIDEDEITGRDARLVTDPTTDAAVNPFWRAAHALGLDALASTAPPSRSISEFSEPVEKAAAGATCTTPMSARRPDSVWTPEKRSRPLTERARRDGASGENTSDGPPWAPRPQLVEFNEQQTFEERNHVFYGNSYHGELSWRPSHVRQSTEAPRTWRASSSATAAAADAARYTETESVNEGTSSTMSMPWSPVTALGAPVSIASWSSETLSIEEPTKRAKLVQAKSAAEPETNEDCMEDAWVRALAWIHQQRNQAAAQLNAGGSSEPTQVITTAADEETIQSAIETVSTVDENASVACMASEDRSEQSLCWPLGCISMYTRWLERARPQWLEMVAVRCRRAASSKTDTALSNKSPLESWPVSSDPTPRLRPNAYPTGTAGDQLRQKHRRELDALVQEGRTRLEQLLAASKRSLAAITNELRRQEHVLNYVRCQHAYERRCLREQGPSLEMSPRLSAEAHIQHALRECIFESHPRVFEVPPEWACSRKLRAVQHALEELVRFNPTANGMQARQEWVRRQRQRQTAVSSGLYVAPRYETYEAALRNCQEVLGPRRFEATAPSLEALREHFERVRESYPHMYTWYRDLHRVVQAATAHNALEMHLFLSLLATCSPNSSIAANTINALLNYRAVSQVRRPRYGSYPMNSLLNYLAGCMGAPSGSKVTAFLDNLLHPDTSRRITVDTHMQKVLLGGSGRLTLNAREYEAMEGVFLAAARSLGEPCPCRLQSCLWALQAGPISYAAELRRYRRCTQIKLRLASAEAAVVRCSDPDVLFRIRQALLELGYLNEFDAIHQEEAFARCSGFVYVPIRRETVRSMRAHVAMRRAFARRQGRTLLPREQAELASFESSITSAEAKGQIDNELEHFEDRARVAADLHRCARLLLYQLAEVEAVELVILPDSNLVKDALEMPLLCARMDRTTKAASQNNKIDASDSGSTVLRRDVQVLSSTCQWVTNSSEHVHGMEPAALPQSTHAATTTKDGQPPPEPMLAHAVAASSTHSDAREEQTRHNAATLNPIARLNSKSMTWTDAHSNDEQDDDEDDDNDDGDWDPYFGAHQWFTDARQRYGIQTLWH
ncbi:hypothetical protein CCYA_CCYA19G4641 [Cyanidiococcus yangmingshanensis]|nr:hypothetical protein CCYA_CCYA19G4641 [Cyanidiococcus yangmingshanensis]